ncbi:MAG: DUF72 domain-containing protein [Candidatus Kryptoniota bacterium]
MCRRKLNVYVGCCGWSYLKPGELKEQIGANYSSTLQAYARIFDCVEVNSTFYHMPRQTTVEKWRRQVSNENKNFKFAIKAYRGITHFDRFGAKSFEYFEHLKEIAYELGSQLILFQSPASFNPSTENINKIKKFFGSIAAENISLVWEPRGSWYDNPLLIKEMCEEHNLIHCVDPFRNEPVAFGTKKIAYFRLHGFGKPSMYNYSYSNRELDKLSQVLDSLEQNCSSAYVFFNNSDCYSNALNFSRTLKKQSK